MRTDVAGRVRNVSLPLSRPLLPLFEAIVNSIQAIEDVGEQKGSVKIGLIRDTTPLLLEDVESNRNIVGFEICDTGIGFTEENYRAFGTSDTTYKANRGGKGIGRFVWLVAFESVEVESIFCEGDVWKKRSFRFVPSGDGIADHKLEVTSSKSRGTRVRLIGFKQRFQSAAPKKPETIGSHIVEHCLEYLIRPNPPELLMVDSAGGESIVLNELFEREMAANASPVSYLVDDVKFNALHVRLYTSHSKEHLIHFCADNRVVKSEKLSGRIPDLAKKLIDGQGKEFIYAAYVDSELLNSNVNQERTDFSISDEELTLFGKKIPWSEVRDAAVGQCREYLLPFTAPIREKKKQRVEKFVATQAPMYRPILKHVGAEVGMLDPEITDEDLDLELYKAYHHLQVKLVVEGRELMLAQDGTPNSFECFRSQFEHYFEKISDINKADLARYVFHRRLVLDFLQKLLRMRDDGKYVLESQVHQLIFPMGATSDEVPFDQHNLWLVDERMAYHKFLASDKQLRQTEPLKSNSKKEPDIIVFDKACAFTNSSEAPFQAITIVEFKRPMRTNYPDDDNPFDQVLEYIEDIRKGKARTLDGRDIPVPEGVHFYCYIVADKSEKLEQQAYKAELERTPDGQGFFGYKKHYKAYIEFISYSKLLMECEAKK